jgi:hypothetical protein
VKEGDAMADESELNELRELCERIVQLPVGHQTCLLEMVLAENRRKWAEALARQRAATLEFLELERRQQAAAQAHPAEGKRDAG